MLAAMTESPRSATLRRTRGTSSRRGLGETDTPGPTAANPQHYGVSRSDGRRDYSVSFASSAQVRQRMQDQCREGTGPEVALRRALHGRGVRFRLHRKLLPNLRRTADIVFGPSRVAVFVDGCFWHGCPDHYVAPRSNAGYWNPKIEEEPREGQGNCSTAVGRGVAGCKGVGAR